MCLILWQLFLDEEWSSKQEALAATVQKLKNGWEARLKSVRRYATELVAHAIEKEHAELNERMAALNAKVAEMKSSQHVDHVQPAQLEKDLPVRGRKLPRSGTAVAVNLRPFRNSRLQRRIR